MRPNNASQPFPRYQELECDFCFFFFLSLTFCVLGPSAEGTTLQLTVEPGMWQHLNTFLACFTSEGYTHLLHLGIRQIMEGLEQSFQDPASINYHVLAAADWIACCPRILKEAMERPCRPQNGLPDEDAAQDLIVMQGVGELCPGNIRPRSLERWLF